MRISVKKLLSGIGAGVLASQAQQEPQPAQQLQPQPTLAQQPATAVATPQAITRFPANKSRIDVFRRLLAATPDECEAILATQPANRRPILELKLREYKMLPPSERELRLEMTELRDYMLKLMKLPPQARSVEIAQIPAKKRKQITDRLQKWDQVPPDEQKELLANENIIHYWVRFETDSPEQKEIIRKRFTDENWNKLEQKIAALKALPDDKRTRMVYEFHQFFELTAKEKSKILNTLSDQERKQMEKLLKEFEQLPPAQRRLAVDSFEKFRNMPIEEQKRFLRNAELWESMTHEDRQAWRTLMQLPPVPADYGSQPITKPPHPGDAAPKEPSTTKSP